MARHQPLPLTQRKNRLYRDLEWHLSNVAHHIKASDGEQSLTDTNDGSKLGLLVLVSVDGDGAQEDESENSEQDEGH